MYCGKNTGGGIIEEINFLVTQAKKKGVNPSILWVGRNESNELREIICNTEKRKDSLYNGGSNAFNFMGLNVGRIHCDDYLEVT